MKISLYNRGCVPLSPPNRTGTHIHTKSKRKNTPLGGNNLKPSEKIKLYLSSFFGTGVCFFLTHTPHTCTHVKSKRLRCQYYYVVCSQDLGCGVCVHAKILAQIVKCSFLQQSDKLQADSQFSSYALRSLQEKNIIKSS